MVRRRVEWSGSINSRECLLLAERRHPPPPGERGGSEERKGIKTIDRELVPGRGIVRSSSGAVLVEGTKERGRYCGGRRGGEVWRKEEGKKWTVKQHGSQRLSGASGTHHHHPPRGGNFIFLFFSRSRRGIGGGEPLTKPCVFLEAGCTHIGPALECSVNQSRGWTTFGIANAQRREQRLYSEQESR